MNNNEDVKIKDLLSRAYATPLTPELQKRMEKERSRIMRELPRGIRSPLITLRLMLIVGIWGMAGFGCLFFYSEIFESVTMVYRCLAMHEPFSNEFMINHLPYYLLVMLGVIETCRLGKEVL